MKDLKKRVNEAVANDKMQLQRFNDGEITWKKYMESAEQVYLSIARQAHKLANSAGNNVAHMERNGINV